MIIPNIWEKRKCSKPPTSNTGDVNSQLLKMVTSYPLVMTNITIENNYVQWKNQLWKHDDQEATKEWNARNSTVICLEI